MKRHVSVLATIAAAAVGAAGVLLFVPLGRQRVTQTYNDRAGNRLVANVAKKSYPYAAAVVITVAEARAGDNT